MPISEKMRRYLQYEIPADAIFNPDHWQFAHAIRIEESRIEDRELILTLTLSDGSRAELRILAWAPRIVRFRFSRPGAHFPESSEMLVAQPNPQRPVLEEAGGKLTARLEQLAIWIGVEPWSFELTDAEGRSLLRSHDSGPKKAFFPLYPLGYQREVDGKATRVFASFDLEPDEALYGLGEKFGALNKRGQSVKSWDSDTTNCSTDRAYKNVPLLLSTHGYGVFLHDGHRIHYELGSWNFTAWSFAVETDQLEWFVLVAPTLRELLQLYTELTGRAPLPPLWSFGLWMSRFGYKNRRELEQTAKELRKRRIPCDVLHLDPYWMREGHYCDFEWDTKAFPNPQEMLEGLAKDGFKVCLWEQPYVPVGTEMHREGEARGYFVKDKRGKTLIIHDFLENPAAIVDFTQPEARDWYQGKHRKLLEMGVAVFKTDMGEAVPKEAVFSDGRTGDEMHNLYPLLYNGTVWEAVAEKWNGQGIVWGRSGYAGSQRFPVQWGGDSLSTFQEMMAVLRGGLSYALSGVPFWSQDIGGFHGDKPTPELYIRWAQWGLPNSHSRCHGVHPREPWEYGERAEEIFRKFAELRYRLLPYIWSVAHEASRTGIPIIRPLVLEFQDDPTTWQIDTEYLFGPYLLVAPVYNERGYVRYYVPDGLWLDFWTGKPLQGPRWVEREIPLEEMPLLIRDGALLPMAPLMQYVGQKPWEPLTLQIFLSTGMSSWRIYDEGSHEIHVQAERSGNRAALTWRGSPVQVSVAWLDCPQPARVLWNGRDLPAGPGGWRYDRAAETLRVDLPGGKLEWELRIEL